ncbi:MAG TPA: hypothetical protein VGD76_17960 [Ramlibacter sp.]
MNHPVDLRFIGMLSSESAEAAALGSISALAAQARVRGWKVSMEPPQSAWGLGAYAVQVQAELDEGALVATRAHGADLLATVHDAFEGMQQLLGRRASGQQQLTCGPCSPR